MVEQTPRRRRRSKGFTLMEVVIALAILAIAFFGMVSVITYTARMNASTRERVFAMRAAERKIEQMLSVSNFEDTFNRFGTFVEGAGWEAVEELGSDGVAYTVLEPPAFTTADVTTTSGYVYPNPTTDSTTQATLAKARKAVLFVRFPLNVAGTGFSEAATSTFTDSGVALDMDRSGTTTAAGDANVQLVDVVVLPVNIEVFWKGVATPKGYLNYRYTFLKKVP